MTDYRLTQREFDALDQIEDTGELCRDTPVIRRLIVRGFINEVGVKNISISDNGIEALRHDRCGSVDSAKPVTGFRRAEDTE